MIRHRNKRIHMIGIGGAGMSPLAELLVHLGYTVTGSDRQQSEVSRRLESLGVCVQYDHTPSLVKQAELLVYSSAIKEDNHERQFASTHGIIQIRRAELLGDLMRAQPTICVSGTHGKTTTTSLIGTLLLNAAFDPVVLVGGMLREQKTHALIGSGQLMVAEADEYDRSFLAMYPTVAVITNIDVDHLDCYRDFEDIKETFVKFIKKVPFFGDVVACIDDDGVVEVLREVTANITTCSVEKEADYEAKNITFGKNRTTFTVVEHGAVLGEIAIPVPGIHNIRNALAAIAVARIMEIDIGVIKSTLSVFKGVHRRFEFLATVNNIRVIDDYAHHPKELAATIEGARQCGAGRIVAVFQPHLYTRTRDFMDSFVEVLMQADIVYVTEIYCAREEPVPGVTASEIVDRLARRGHGRSRFVADRKDLSDTIMPELRPDDYVLFMGAGDITESAGEMAEVLNGQA